MHRRAGRLDEAVALWERVRSADPEASVPRIALADHYQSVGRTEEARTLGKEILALNPDYTSESAAERLMGQAGEFGDPDLTARITARLRGAGLP